MPRVEPGVHSCSIPDLAVVQSSNLVVGWTIR
jgi:hypothetical protein